MNDIIKNVSLFIVVGLLLTTVCGWLQSNFLITFLDENLVTLLITLMAINTATISVIMTKLKEITEKNKLNFSLTIHSLKTSIVEQVILIAVALIFLIIKNSSVLTQLWSNLAYVINSLIFAVFAYAIHVLYDTANGVFVILHYENHDNDTST